MAKTIIIQTNGGDPRTTRYLQADGTWGLSSTAVRFKTFKAAEQDPKVLSGEGIAVRVISEGK